MIVEVFINQGNICFFYLDDDLHFFLIIFKYVNAKMVLKKLKYNFFVCV